MTNKRRTLLFDLGGVLLENGGREALTALLPPGTLPGDVRLRWLACPIVAKFERGQIDAVAFASALVREWQLTLDAQAFLASFATWPKGFYPGAAALLADLRTRHRVACLSNSNDVHWKRFPEIGTLFDVALSSHHLGCVKPERIAFERALERLACDASQVWFFDDLAPNIETARSLGMHAFQVDGLDDVRDALRREGLLEPA